MPWCWSGQTPEALSVSCIPRRGRQYSSSGGNRARSSSLLRASTFPGFDLLDVGFRFFDNRISTASPNSSPILGLQKELVSGDNPVGFVPRFNIPHRVTSIFAGRMVVRRDLPAQHGLALRPAPSLREGQKKTLFPGQSADHGVGLAFQREDVGVMSYQKSCNVGNILAQDLVAIDAEIGKWAIRAKLLY